MTGGLPDNFHLRRAAQWVRAGGVIAYPTEAVFGLGCDPAAPQAVFRLLAIKHRPPDKGLILVAADWAQLQPWLRPVPRRQWQRLQRSWPGPVTWLVPAVPDCPNWLTGGRPNLAVRISAHPWVRSLCLRAGTALVSTSANISDQAPARSILQVQLRFAGRIDYLLPGPLGGADRPTVIRDLATGRTVRA